MIFTAIGFAVLAAVAGATAALAYGYRGQRDQEREQVRYLRAELAARPPSNVTQHPSARGTQF